MNNKWQKYLVGTIIVLLIILVITKVVLSYQSKKLKWQPADREQMVSDCISDLGSYSVRFPSQSIEYCSCSSDTLMSHFTKAEYLLLMDKSEKEQDDAMISVIGDCYTRYQQAMFRDSNLN